ncbi:MAG: LLM class flavin-dependent oxidoreductase [Chloroflexi bacterium]|nr:LLM class flavin-dependent oxidoreductase [Chloroflexota bacterium]
MRFAAGLTGFLITYSFLADFKEAVVTDRVGLYLQDAHEISEGIELVRYAEDRGFEAVWQAESRLVRDAVVPMAAFAACSERIKVGSGVINNWTRNVALTAATFLTLDDLSPDRILCGIGAWWDPLAANVGVQRRKPLLAMREYVTVLRDLLNMKRVTFHGEFVQVTDIELDVVHGRREPRNVPIYIGATGPKMLALSGEIADGVLLNYMVSPDYNDMAIAQIERGAQLAGRRLEDIDRPQLVICSVDRDRKRALDASRKLVTQYLGQQPHLMKASGVDPSLLDEIHRVLKWPATEEEIENAMTLVPDEIVQQVTASGTPEEVKAKVREYVSHGCTCPVLYPLGPDVRLMIDTFADGYLN